ncbi:MAG: NAD-dependent epimerase/dehydratase family protein [Candidatus Jordarchaeaceae archaeon]
MLAGSSGTIGTRLFETALGLGYAVDGIDKRKNKWNTSLNSKTIRTNLLKEEKLERISSDYDLIIHLAANARVFNLIKEPRLALENIIITFNILEFVRKNDISSVVLISSREVYGNITNLVHKFSEELIDIRNCGNQYSASKISSESLVCSYAHTYGIDYVIVRLSNVYGMYDDSDRIIPLWIKETLVNRDLIIYGKEKKLDFVYIDDVVDGILKVIMNFKKVKGEIFNIASDESVELTYVARKIISLLDGKNKIIIRPNRRGETLKFIADIGKAKKLLGYKPKVGIDEGLRKTIQWYREFYSRRVR